MRAPRDEMHALIDEAVARCALCRELLPDIVDALLAGDRTRLLALLRRLEAST